MTDVAKAGRNKTAEATPDAAPAGVAGSGSSLTRRVAGTPETGTASLTTELGKIRIADGVVAKIAGLATREIPGVHSMGTGLARRLGQLRSMVPGSTEVSRATQGVTVEVGEREAAVDLDIVTWYGQSIVEVSEAVRRNVLDRVEGMTGLKIVEININVDDIYVEGADEEPAEQRVH